MPIRVKYTVEFVVDQVTVDGAEILVSKMLGKVGTAKVNVVGFQRQPELSEAALSSLKSVPDFSGGDIIE